MTIKGYDQWKTASPYDDEPEYEAECPKCKSVFYDLLRDYTADENCVLLVCSDCGHEYSFDPDKIILTEAQEKEINELELKLLSFEYSNDPIQTTEEIFGLVASDEDFSWHDSEAGDWHVYNCGEKDCPQQWHLVAYAIDMGRNNAKRWIRFSSVDSDGNWDTDDIWCEKEGNKANDEQWKCMMQTLQRQLSDFFLGWARYWLDCAQTGNDPCKQVLKEISTGKWVEFCIDAAKNNIKCLFTKEKEREGENPT